MRHPNQNCLVCSKAFYCKPFQLKKNEGKAFCSKVCYGFFCRKEVPCIICGSLILSSKNKKTCSEQCHSVQKIKHNKERTWGIGKRDKETVTTKQARKKLIAERGSCCQLCDYKVEKVLNIHHIIEKAKGGLNLRSNLIVVCPNCHAEIHAGLIVLAELENKRGLNKSLTGSNPVSSAKFLVSLSS